MVRVRWKLVDENARATDIEWKLQPASDGAGPETVIDFEAINQAAHDENTLIPRYFAAHYAADGTFGPGGPGSPSIALRVRATPAIGEDVTVSYTLTGTAVAGTHYQEVSSSPITIPAGTGEGFIRFDLLEPGAPDWFDEKSIIVRLTGSPNDKGTIADDDEYRVWTRPIDTVLPPFIEHAATSDSGGDATYTVDIQLVSPTTDSGEDVNVHYTAVGSTSPLMTEDTHWSITPSGTPTIEAGDPDSTTSANQLRLVIGSPTSAPSGGEVIITLDHEPSTQDEENFWTFTHDWTPETYDPDDKFPAEPTTHGASGGQSPFAGAFRSGTVVIGQDELNHPETGLPFWNIPTANQIDQLDGVGKMQALLMHELADSDFYIRESFEGAVYSGLTGRSISIAEFNLCGCYVKEIPSPEDFRIAPFIKLIMRNRPNDTQNGVVFRRQPTGATDFLDSAGDQKQLYTGGSLANSVTIGSSDWSIWELENPHPDDKYGMESETVNGETYARPWFAHSVPADGTFSYDDNTTDYGHGYIEASVQAGPVFICRGDVDAVGTTLLLGTGIQRSEDLDGDGAHSWVSSTFTATHTGTEQDGTTVSIGPVLPNDIFFNTRDGSRAFVVSIDAGNRITLSTPAFGRDNDLQVGDRFHIFRPKLQRRGDLQNAIYRFTQYGGGDAYNGRPSSQNIIGGKTGARGKGWLVDLPHYFADSSAILNGNQPPTYDPTDVAVNSGGRGRPWEHKGNWARPRGLGYIVTGGDNVYTFTVT